MDLFQTSGRGFLLALHWLSISFLNISSSVQIFSNFSLRVMHSAKHLHKQYSRSKTTHALLRMSCDGTKGVNQVM